MNTPPRRVIRKPAGMDEDACRRLRDALDEAVRRQQALAGRSAHVLRLQGGCEEDDTCLWVSHEPASSLHTGDLFNPRAEALDAPALLNLTASVLGAAQVAHCSSPPVVHGGICPGVILRTADGRFKLTDFGFAPAMTAVLGESACAWLCVSGAHAQAADAPAVTGNWEAAAPDRTNRDDRLCGFIDPEKYGTGLLRSFESGGDVFAAGCLLYLLAHHRHPYFYDEPDGPNCVDAAEFMAMRLPTSAFRRDLRESADPLVRRWTTLVQAMIDRLPGNRPTMAQVLQELQPLGLDAYGRAEPASAGDRPVAPAPVGRPTRSTASPVVRESAGAPPARPREISDARPVVEHPSDTAQSATPSSQICVVSELAGRQAKLERASLMLDGSADDRRVLLLGRGVVRLGRSRECNDIVLRILPRSPVADRLTRQISGQKPHLVISLRSDGVFVADQDTLNGTNLNGRPLKGEQNLPLDTPSRIVVGKTLELNVTPLRADSPSATQAVDHYETLGPADELWTAALGLGLTALLIQRTNNLADQEQYLVLYRWAGCDLAAHTVIVAENGSSAGPWRLIRRAGQYWLENRSGNRTVEVDHVRVPPGHLCPLAPGMTLRPGGRQLRFAEFGQVGL